MLPLGTPAPSFSLPDLTGRIVSDRDFAGSDALVVTFICPHCPYVKHVRPALARLAKDYMPRGVAVVAINSNDAVAYPEDDLPGMRKEAATAGYAFPYLRDESQDVARAFRAACTPDFFVFDRNRRLVYRGQFDSTRPSGSAPANGEDLKAALDAVLASTPVPDMQRPSVGCGIKWKPDRAPRN